MAKETDDKTQKQPAEKPNSSNHTPAATEPAGTETKTDATAADQSQPKENTQSISATGATESSPEPEKSGEPDATNINPPTPPVTIPPVPEPGSANISDNLKKQTEALINQSMQVPVVNVPTEPVSPEAAPEPVIENTADPVQDAEPLPPPPPEQIITVEEMPPIDPNLGRKLRQAMISDMQETKQKKNKSINLWNVVLVIGIVLVIVAIFAMVAGSKNQEV